jgi:hypothetical protein
MFTPHRDGAASGCLWKATARLLNLCGFGLWGALIVALAAPAIAQDRGARPADEEVQPAADFGAYRALIIGIDGYKQWPRLRFAEQDATELRDILISGYDFDPERVVTLEGAGATRVRILQELRNLLERSSDDDNVLIFFAGHGQLDTLTETGFWIPVDGGLFDEPTWIPFDRVTGLLKAPGVKAKTILVITDSCYGGALTRAGPTPGHVDPEEPGYVDALRRLASKRSRQVIASGGFEEVPDRSNFADLLKDALRQNRRPVVDMEYLFYKEVYPGLRTLQQDPVMTRLVTGPNQDGQFILVRREGGQPPPPNGATLSVRSNVHDDTVYIDGDPRGSTQLTLDLAPGSYAVRVEKAGYNPYQEEVTLKAGTEVVVWADLKKQSIAPPRIEVGHPVPMVHSKGQLTIKQTWTADLDEGKVGAGDEADIWFQAATATERYVTPRKGARIAKAGKRSVGPQGCAKLPLSSQSISIQALTPGTYVCVKTNKAQYSEFRVLSQVGPSPGTLRIAYTTWERTAGVRLSSKVIAALAPRTVKQPVVLAKTTFQGVWQNKDPATRSITKLEIKQSGDKVTVHAWGKCHPKDCDWGEESGAMRKNTASVAWDQGFVVRKMTLTLQGKDLTVLTDSTYRDNRPRRQSRNTFVRVK